ncbi:MAG: hypothetical protein EOO82_03885 [Oxalobacteraceae bacterium]|nr:MAG: hypothetical protein EOO82_03885 [Oxalobacteraceae bacterium]
MSDDIGYRGSSSVRRVGLMEPSRQLPAIGAPGTTQQFIAVSDHDLDAALDADSRMALPSDHKS